jgi:hypothetical protein
MVEIKAEILNGTKMSCLKVYFTINIKLSMEFYASDNTASKYQR